MLTLNIPNFDLRQTAASGQCFRMNPVTASGVAADSAAAGTFGMSSDSGCRYSVISQGYYLELSQSGTSFHFYCPDEEFPFWRQYFDLDTDYGRCISSVKKKDLYLQKAAEAGNGIRILNQDPWEMILTFIISQQKTIPKIKEAVEALSLSYGTKKAVFLPDSGTERIFTAFPDARSLSAASLEDLKALKLGYRAKYIYRICQDCHEGTLDLQHLAALNYEDAMEYLTGFYGIGTKVANCICLFGLHHIEAFPVDTWIEQILTEHYYRKKYDALPKSRLYETIIKDNFGCYKGYAGIMQQYIFYYERLCRNKII